MTKVLIIGAGIGGLALAIRLQGAGYRVTLVEQNEHVGGRANVIRDQGFVFDTGPTLLLMVDVLHELFACAGRGLTDYLDLVRLQPNYRVHFADGTFLDLTSDLPAQIAQLSRFTDRPAERLLGYLADAAYKYRVARERFVERSFRSLAEFATPANLVEVVKTGTLGNLYQHVSRYFDDERLKIAFTFQTMYLGISPHDAPAIYALLPYTELAEGIWYPRGGIYQLVEALVRVARELGVRIATGTRVRRVLVEGRRAVGVETVQGVPLQADLIVSNVDLPTTYRELLPPAARGRFSDRALDHLRYTSSAVLLYLGVDRRYDQLLHHNVFLAADPRRNFEEIFRQGEPPPGGASSAPSGQGPNAQQAQELAELQKQILNATWKVIRRETGSRPSDAFAPDVEQIRLSQAAALEQAWALLTRLQDPQSQAHAAAVVEAMERAVEALGESVGQRRPMLLKEAQKAEQAAYQALLRLRAREHQVVRQNPRQMAGGRSSARSAQQRQQMQQLELAQDENRYETQRQAQDLRESPQERENRQILSRLKELAQRQQDLNQRLKELQAALQEAATPHKREELARQLQRLQEEQRQILQDTEELQARMESPENLQRMAAERQQLDQTREQVQRAAEALEQTRITQAAASGTRAEQSFQELRDEFRRRTSSRFRDQMQELRQAAQTLEAQQEELAQRLAQAAEPDASPRGKSLRESDERQRLTQDLQQQRQRLATLQEQMRRTVEEAETTEPLLAERLYEALRSAEDQGVERALESVQRSLQNGLLRDAVQQEQPAGRGIRQLREGIDRAAEAVLGDETEALRRARQELYELAEQLQREIERHAPQLAPGAAADASRPRGPS
ncbi:MAG: phytoene desaturase, partial [Chloroflexi bacterium]|nr:phytoene desaturase [Chloroflexota bacterium]